MFSQLHLVFKTIALTNTNICENYPVNMCFHLNRITRTAGSGEKMTNASMEIVPKSLRNMRACLLCSLIKTIDQFEYDGCDNCDEFLHMRSNRDMVYDCTSSSFDGTIAMMSPEDSWVAKWQGIKKFKPGVYAISVTGRLPNSIIRDLKANGVTYQSRDRSQKAGE